MFSFYLLLVVMYSDGTINTNRIGISDVFLYESASTTLVRFRFFKISLLNISQRMANVYTVTHKKRVSRDASCLHVMYRQSV